MSPFCLLIGRRQGFWVLRLFKARPIPPVQLMPRLSVVGLGGELAATSCRGVGHHCGALSARPLYGARPLLPRVLRDWNPLGAG